MKFAYFTNQYPAPSQTFIRQEIAAHEAAGWEVPRYAIRTWPGVLADPNDLQELARTRHLLAPGAGGLGRAMFGAMLRTPGRFARAFRTAMRLGGRNERGRLVHLIYLAEACLLADWCRRDGIDHLHVHFGTNSATVALLANQLGGPGYSFTVHGPEEFDHPEAISLGEKVEGSRFAVAISEFGRSQLFRWTRRQHWPKVHVVHCGVGADYLHVEPSVPPRQARLVNVGRLAEQKGQLLLVEAARRLRDRGLEFEVLIVGGGPLQADLERVIAEAELADVVKLVGWKSNADVRALLLDSRGLVLPSFAEGLPVVVMESLALSRPVVTTYIAGIPELVEPGKCGWLVPAGDVDALVDAMADALTCDVSRLSEMGSEGATRVRRDHDVSVEAAKLRQLIEASFADAPEGLAHAEAATAR